MIHQTELQNQAQLVLDRLQNAEYLHLLLEPLPLFGFLFLFIFLAIGLLFHQTKCRSISLILLILVSLSVIPYQQQRSAAHSRTLATREVNVSKVRQVTQLRAKWQPAYLIFAVIAFVALLSGGRLQFFLNYVVLLLLLFLIPLSLWFHIKEAESFHPNLLESRVQRA